MDDKRTIVWFSAFVVVVMLIGVASGILLDRFLLRPPRGRLGPVFGRGPGMEQRMGQGGMGPGAMGPGALGPGPGRAQRLGPGGLPERLARELGLTAAQKEQVGAILGRRRARLEEVRAEMQGRMQKEQSDLRAEIRQGLDEKQQKRFDEVMASAPGLGGGDPGQRGMRRGPPSGQRDERQ
jgi:hypothetical protein